ncbi:MAG: DUF4870 domain-containing protein [Desulfobacteraceae bacterium]|nr:DUF4870 domain-containing protein [Desulfobacteraceae bacterium]
MTKQKVNNPANTWAMVCHLLGLCTFVGIPFGNIIGPLVVWLIKGKEFDFVDEQGKEALNFQISMTIYGLVAGFLCLFIIGFFLLFALVIADVVFIIIAAMKTNEGESYRYPYIFRLVK